jgi:hypothetical protein
MKKRGIRSAKSSSGGIIFDYSFLLIFFAETWLMQRSLKIASEQKRAI